MLRRMRKYFPGLAWMALAGQLAAAERKFDFSQAALDAAPPDCHSAVTGEGKPGAWKVILADAPSAYAASVASASGFNGGVKRAVVAQTATDMTDEHFPLLILGEDVYGDFTLATRFKIVDGTVEQMAGLAFRLQDEKNYYVARVSALGKNVRFYKVVNGERSPPIGPSVDLSRGEWHELSVECNGNRIRCRLDGKEIIPELIDNSFSAGKIAYWTKSDAVSYFTDTRIEYTVRETFVQSLVRDELKKHPKLLGLRIYALAGNPPEPRVVASGNDKEIGQAGGKTESETIHKDLIFYGKENQTALVTLPLHD
ncbi:MAG TPA: family 16 glycoside hydrolase, partial [Verrucomicrobiae bacterium]|nr:family 16 glycoside hydrolase [Verrucomicrobiae bacterium]